MGKSQSKCPEESTEDSEGGKLMFVEDQKIIPVEWENETNEGLCKYIMRLCGLEDDSANEFRKKQQKYRRFVPGIGINETALLSEDLEADKLAIKAAISVQTFYRKYLLIKKWKQIVIRVVDRIRRERMLKQAMIEDETILENFQNMLISGFVASKISSNGKRKNITIQLVLKPESGKCYLTWKPYKKKPKVHIDEIDEIVKFSKKVTSLPAKVTENLSYRKCLIIYSKSIPGSGRLVFQVGSGKDRDLLFKGFQKMMTEIRDVKGHFDAAGMFIRQKSRNRALGFFEKGSRKKKHQRKVSFTDACNIPGGHNPGSIPGGNESSSAIDECDGSSRCSSFASSTNSAEEDITIHPIDQNIPQSEKKIEKIIPKAPKSLESFYNTRYDKFANTVNTIKVEDARKMKVLEDEQNYDDAFQQKYTNPKIV